MASGSNVTLEQLDEPVDDHLHYPSVLENVDISTSSFVVEEKSRPVQTDKLYVGNLPLEISLVDLHKAFKRFGDITDIQLPYNTGPGGRPKGYAFVSFSRKEDATKAQIKMDGALLARRMIKVDFAHHEMKTTSSVRSKRLKDNTQVTTLSMLKGNQAGRNTNEQIARAEAKLRELNRPDTPAGGLPAHHASLPAKPPPTLTSSMPGPRRQGSSGLLPTLPLAPMPKHPPSKAQTSPFSRPSETPPPLVRLSSGSSMAGASFTKKTSKLSGVKIVKKAKLTEGEKS
ncbi:hypothetical protein CPB83DRAFT_909585 [Crepidotus variabilis]|uniref:RRM domain-containing protein n=1 Tax=Crepidotus variabilis TaxID=179855 RepID=A0A9P6JLP7_9AGAR|nr:hypothetical protein CPB83DRAFT_909585 [Crepidotus variabilis]